MVLDILTHQKHLPRLFWGVLFYFEVCFGSRKNTQTQVKLGNILENNVTQIRTVFFHWSNIFLRHISLVIQWMHYITPKYWRIIKWMSMIMSVILFQYKNCDVLCGTRIVPCVPIKVSILLEFFEKWGQFFVTPCIFTPETPAHSVTQPGTVSN